MEASAGVVTFVTGNVGKKEDFLAVLAEFDSLADRFCVADLHLAEICAGHREIAVAKCREAARILGRAVVVEDTALELNALGGMPGPYVKCAWKRLGNFHLPKLLAAFDDKSALAKSIVAYADSPEAEVRLFEGECHGWLVQTPRGPNVHAWLPLLLPAGCSMTLAEMDWPERARHYHRAESLRKFFKFFAKKCDEEAC